MSLACNTGADYGDEYDWYYNGPGEHKPLEARRGRRCSSCRTMIRVGQECVPFHRWRKPRSEIEDDIYGWGGEVPLATWYYCDRCGHQAHALHELGFTWELGEDSMADLVNEYKVQYQGQDDPCNTGRKAPAEGAL